MGECMTEIKGKTEEGRMVWISLLAIHFFSFSSLVVLQYLISDRDEGMKSITILLICLC